MESIGRYRIIKCLGEGGMGVVYEAHDDRLARVVAVKLMRDAIVGPESTERFWREARAAAAISHPHVCQIYELGEDSGRPFIVMERLAGETLAERLARGPLPAREAARLSLGLLDALEALHLKQVVHRDLKPTNVFLTPHGVKLLDFGLARDVGTLGDSTGSTRLTNPGLLVGTPRYMAPEQITGASIDARTDLFAAGSILFEMLSGHPAFEGESAVEALTRVLHEHPPALLGSPMVMALDSVIHRALAKSLDSRYPTAAAMAAEIRGTLVHDDSGTAPRVTTMTRLVVLPFKLLRPDADTEFLAFSLPDAITSSLSAYEAISVRSPLAASRFATPTPDLQALAEQLDVDHVLTGTLLRSGDQLRISVQLVQAPAGRVIWSHGAQTAMGDLFELQDTLSQGIVNALPVAAPASRTVDVPKAPRAYELYLRANQLALESGTYRLALSFYERCIEDDPDFAPAWARLGRTRRVVGKYLEPDPMLLYGQAEEAFKRALTLNPDLALAHSLYSYLEVELGRADQAMVRMLALIKQQPGNAELLAALCHSLRYCGLLNESVAAHRRARRLDPQVRTSVQHTYFMLGDYQRALDEIQWITDPLQAVALISLGRQEEALAAIKIEEERFASSEVERHFASHLRGLAQGDRSGAVSFLESLMRTGFHDGEGFYYCTRSLAYVGASDLAIDAFRRVLEFGFFCYPAFARDPWLDSLRGMDAFETLMKSAERRNHAAARAFTDAGGDRLLGMS